MTKYSKKEQLEIWFGRPFATCFEMLCVLMNAGKKTSFHTERIN